MDVFVCRRQGGDGGRAMISDPREMDVDVAGSEVSWVMFARVRGRKDLQQRLPSSY